VASYSKIEMSNPVVIFFKINGVAQSDSNTGTAEQIILSRIASAVILAFVIHLMRVLGLILLV